MASKRDKGMTWIVRATAQDRGDYRTLTLDFLFAARHDVADEAAGALRRGAESELRYFERKAAALREATGDTVSYAPVYGVEFSLHWQANLPGHTRYDGRVAEASGWYGIGIDGGKLGHRVAQALAKIAPLCDCGQDPEPQAVIDAVKAKRAKYVEDAYEFAPTDAPLPLSPAQDAARWLRRACEVAA